MCAFAGLHVNMCGRTHLCTHVYMYISFVSLKKPSYKNYRGEIELGSELHRYNTYGIISVIDETTVEISELPIKVWTQQYKEAVMDTLLYGNEKVQPMIK